MAIPLRIPARSGRNPAKIRRASFSLSLFFFFDEQIWGLIRERHEAGVGGGRFIGAVWAIHCLSLSLARSQSPQSPSHTHRRFGSRSSVIRSLSLFLACSVSLSHSLLLAHSLPLTLTGGLGHATRSFNGGIEGSEPHHTREPFLLGSRISAANFPQGRRRTPKLDQREK
jgi:hypothetical protein